MLTVPSQTAITFSNSIRNTRTISENYSKLTIETLERRQWRGSGVFNVNFEQISSIVLVFPMLTLNI